MTRQPLQQVLASPRATPASNRTIVSLEDDRHSQDESNLSLSDAFPGTKLLFILIIASRVSVSSTRSLICSGMPVSRVARHAVVLQIQPSLCIV
ncbi:hypothetical protein ACA910_001935 [Epithemia clementina (nom. ined.)]